MKSVALTEGKKAHFYDLNRQFGIERNSSPKIRHTAARDAVICSVPRWAQTPASEPGGDGDADRECARAQRLPEWLG